MNGLKRMILLALCMLVFDSSHIWAIGSAPQLQDGIYQIKKADELLWFADQVSNKGQSAIKCLLLNDIDMTGKDWIPIGYSPEKNSFWGVFDGGGHTISGISIQSTLSGNWQYCAIFNSATHCTIRNLSVRGSINCTASGSSCMAGLIARVWDAKVENVHSYLDIAVVGGFFGVGGVAGYVHDASVLEDCSFHGTITCSDNNAYGGIAGNSAEGYIRNCANYGNFTIKNTNARCGGILGLADNAKIELSHSLDVETQAGKKNFLALIGHVNSMSFSASKSNYYVSANGTKASDNDSFQATVVTQDELTSGKVTYNLNAGQTAIHWYQTLGEDAFPVLDSTHSEVQLVNGKYLNPNGKEAAQKLLSQELAYCDTVVAQQSLIDVYRKTLSTVTEEYSPTDVFDLYNSLLELRSLLQQSAETYSSFCASLDEYRKLLAAFTSDEGEKYQLMQRYLNSMVEPCQEFSNGSSLYIVQNHVLGESSLRKELEWLENLWYVIQHPQYGSRRDVTHLLINPDFSDKFYGWQNVGASNYTLTEGTIKVNEINDSLNVYQTLTGLPDGLYEFRMKGYYGNKAKDESASINHAALIYANDGVNYLCTQDEVAASGMENSILVHVTNGVLYVGVRVPEVFSDSGNITFADAHLYYYQDVAGAGMMIQDVLDSQAARANAVLQASYPSVDGDYTALPNFSQALKDSLSQAVETSSQTTENQGRLQLIQRFSSLFEQILDCRSAYLELITHLDELQGRVEIVKDFLTEEQMQEYENLRQLIKYGYDEGLYTAEEARGYQQMNSLSFLAEVKSKEPALVNGYYQIEDAGNLLWFAQAVNSGSTSINAQLTNDINIIGILSWDPIGISAEKNSFCGTFDGQNHTISGFCFTKELGTWGVGGFFGCITYGTVKNLRISGKMTCKGGSCSMFGAIGRAWKTTLINVHVEMDMDAKSEGYFGVGGLVGYAHDNTIIQGCSFSGSIQCNSGDAYGGLVGRCVAVTVFGCANYGQVYNNSGSSSVAGLVGASEDKSFVLSHCLNVGEMHGSAPALVGYLGAYNSTDSYGNYWYKSSASKAFGGSKSLSKTYSVGESELASGQVTYELNESQDQVHWYQTLGQDPYPLLDSTHGEVTKENDDYINTGIASPSISNTRHNGKIYDMSGRIVKKATNGFYIIDGKKLLIKD